LAWKQRKKNIKTFRKKLKKFFLQKTNQAHRTPNCNKWKKFEILESVLGVADLA